MSNRIPLHILTGFLGSGKTTLLNRMLLLPAWADSAVLINEIGEISIDHDLVERVESGNDVDIIVLKGGCTCCALRGDMIAALRELHARRVEGAIPSFARVVLETSGLADPAPVLYTLLAEPALRHKFERGIVITTIEAMQGTEQLRRHPEARRQLAMADRIVMTKIDLVDDTRPATLAMMIQAMNPAASVLDACHAATPEALLANDDASIAAGDRAYGLHKSDIGDNRAYGSDKSFFGASITPRNLLQRATASRKLSVHDTLDDTLAEKLGEARLDLEQSNGHRVAAIESEHSQRIDSVALLLDEPVAWSPFSVWLTLLLHAHGSKILRFKAVLDVVDWPMPVALDAIHHVIHPPRHLLRWPQGQRVSRLVFIAQDLDVSLIEPSLRGFLARNAARRVA